MASLNFKPEYRVTKFSRSVDESKHWMAHWQAEQRIARYRRKRLLRMAWHVIAFSILALAAFVVAGLSAGGR